MIRAAQGPTVWFQESGQRGTDRQRWHYDVWVPSDAGRGAARGRHRAGGTLVGESPSTVYWVVADADGNRSCVCTAAAG